MIDIHNHLIYGVDDGSDSLKSSLEMIRDGYMSGVDTFIITPHFMRFGPYRATPGLLKERFEFLCEAVKEEKLDVKLYLGNELMICSKLDEYLITDKCLPLADSQYVLVEFPFDAYDSEYDEVLYNLTTYDYRVIIAHPERYKYVQNDISFADRWLNEGYLLQSNADSLNDKKKRKVISALIKEGKLHFIASDAHHPKYRPVDLDKAWSFVSKEFGDVIADRLMNANPECIIKNVPIPEMPDLVSQKKTVFGF